MVLRRMTETLNNLNFVQSKHANMLTFKKRNRLYNFKLKYGGGVKFEKLSYFQVQAQDSTWATNILPHPNSTKRTVNRF